MTDSNLPAADRRRDESVPAAGANERWLILNPTSGEADHVAAVERRAADEGYAVYETERAGHATQLARAAAVSDVDVLAVAGGDGTLHEVVHGLAAADALGDVTVGVIPTGTANLFATKVGVTDVEQGFAVLERGARRWIDVGFADGEPFALSCIAGLTANASVAASSELKARFGSLAFVIAGVREAAAFDPLRVELTAVADGTETTWSGEALCVLVGNVRRFVHRGGQARVEDGRFEVVVIEEMPAGNVVAEAMAHRLLGRDTEHVHHVQASRLEIDGRDDGPLAFSVDGERRTHDRLSLSVAPQALTVCVGPGYEPDPQY